MKILVLHANALHLGYLGCYGNEWVETPTLNRLAAEGVVFDAHFADWPALERTQQTSIRTGRHRLLQTEQAAGPSIDDVLREHGIPQITLGEEGGADVETFFAALSTAVQSLDTANNAVLWLDWPDLSPPWEIPDEVLDLYFGADIIDDEELVPWPDPPTGPFDVNEGNKLERLQETYAAVATTFDTLVEMVLELLDEHGGRASWHIILTAGCGFALGEHGVIGEHHARLHEEVVHIPLLMRFPDGVDAGARIAALTQPVDLLPTICELLQLPPLACDGHSLLPLIREQANEIRPFACSGLQVGENIEWSLRTPECAFLLAVKPAHDEEPRRPQLFVKPDDRWENNDLSQHHQEECEELEKTLREFIAGDRNARSPQADS